MWDSVHSQSNCLGKYTNSWPSTRSLRIEPYCQLPLLLVHWSYRKRTTHALLYKSRGVRWQMHRESSLQLIALTSGTDISNNADLNIKCNEILQYLFSVHMKRYWRSFESRWIVKPKSNLGDSIIRMLNETTWTAKKG